MTPEQRRALQLTSAWLYLLVRSDRIDERARAKITVDGREVYCSVGEAIDAADAALEPEHAKENTR